MSQAALNEKKTVARPVTPLGILVEYLEEAQKLIDKANVPAELAVSLQKAYDLAAGIDPYLNEFSTPESPALANLTQKTSTEDWSQRFSDGETVRHLEQEMLSSCG